MAPCIRMTTLRSIEDVAQEPSSATGNQPTGRIQPPAVGVWTPADPTEIQSGRLIDVTQLFADGTGMDQEAVTATRRPSVAPPSFEVGQVTAAFRPEGMVGPADWQAAVPGGLADEQPDLSRYSGPEVVDYFQEVADRAGDAYLRSTQHGLSSSVGWAPLDVGALPGGARTGRARSAATASPEREVERTAEMEPVAERGPTGRHRRPSLAATIVRRVQTLREAHAQRQVERNGAAAPEPARGATTGRHRGESRLRRRLRQVANAPRRIVVAVVSAAVLVAGGATLLESDNGPRQAQSRPVDDTRGNRDTTSGSAQSQERTQRHVSHSRHRATVPQYVLDVREAVKGGDFVKAQKVLLARIDGDVSSKDMPLYGAVLTANAAKRFDDASAELRNAKSAWQAGDVNVARASEAKALKSLDSTNRLLNRAAWTMGMHGDHEAGQALSQAADSMVRGDQASSRQAHLRAALKAVAPAARAAGVQLGGTGLTQGR